MAQSQLNIFQVWLPSLKKDARTMMIVGGAATKDDVAWLLQEVHQCPACALSVLRQAKVYGQDFNYQELKREWWAERSREFRDMVGGNLGSY